MYCRNAPIPLSLFGEEEDDSAPSEPVLDLAAPWGGFLQPGQPWASAVAEQEKAAASQPAVTHAAQAPDTTAVPVPEMTFTSQQPGPAPHLGPGSSLAAESSDSWATVFTEASQALPGSNGALDGPAASKDAAGAAQSDAAKSPSGVGDQPSLQQQTGDTSEHITSTSHVLWAVPIDRPGHATQHLHPDKPAAESADAADNCQADSTPAEKGATSAQAGLPGQSQGRMPPGSIDWSAMDFDFGAPGSPVNAAQPASQQACLDADEADKSSTTAAVASANHAHGLPKEALDSRHALPEQPGQPESAAQQADEEDDWDFGDFAEATASVPDTSLESAPDGGLPALKLQNFQAPWATDAQPAAEPFSASPEPVNEDWDTGSLAAGSDTAATANQDGSGSAKPAAVVDIESAVAGDGWGSWDASEAAADSSAPVTAQLGGALNLAAALPSPRLSVQLAPGGSGVLSFDQWGRAYSKLEQQAAKSGAVKQPTADPKAAKSPAADADTFSLSESSWGASQAPAADVWASLAALDEGHALGNAADSAANQPPAQHAHTAGSIPSHDAFADPFAAFDSVAEEVEEGPPAGPAAASTEGELLSLPMPALGSTAASWSAEDGFVRDQHLQHVQEAAEGDVIQASAAGSADSNQQAQQASKESTGELPSFTAQRSWGDGWADCVADSMAPLPAQATQPPDTVSSWRRQEEDLALEKALGCDRQTALLCLAQVCFPCASHAMSARLPVQ